MVDRENQIPVEESERPPETTAREVTLHGIIDAVSEYYGVTSEDLLEQSRDSAVNDARAFMLCLISDYTPLSHERIAEITGRWQGTVSQSIRRVRERADHDPKLRQHLEVLTKTAAGEPLPDTLTTWPELVKNHYEMSLEEIQAGKTQETTEARQVLAYLFSEKTTLRKGAIARRTGLVASANVAHAVERVREKVSGDERFATAIDTLSEGKLPETPKVDDVLDAVTAYYGITRADLLGHSRKDKHVKPRHMAMHLIARELGRSYLATGRIFNTTDVRDRVLDFEQRLAGDSRLQQQRAEILNPKTIDREPASQRVMKTVCDFYGVIPEEVLEERPSDRFMRPREVTTYLLREQLGLSFPEIKDQMQRSESAVLNAYHRLEDEITQNPLLAAEVKYLKGAKRIGRSINERIIGRVAEATGVHPDDILAGTDSEARQLAMALLAERGHLSSREVAELFGLTTEGSVYRARTVIDYQTPRNPLLAQRQAWVRERIFSERSASFVFRAEASGELEEGREVFFVDGLPEIEEHLVHPEIRNQIYGIVGRVASFYSVRPKEVVGRTDEFVLTRARRAAVLLCHQERIPATETAVCFDARTSGSIGGLLETARIDLERHKIFAEELRALEKGEKRRDVLGETLRSAARYYGVSTESLRTGKSPAAARGRVTFLMVMTEHACATQRQLGKAVGKTEENAGAIIFNTKKRLQKDPRLQAEIRYLSDPESVPRPPDADDILAHLRHSFGISAERLRNPQTDEEREAKRLASYVLAEELAMPHKEIARLLLDNPSNMPWYMRHTRAEITKDARKILEIDRLLPPHSTSFSMTGRVLKFVSRQYQVELEGLASLDDTPQLNQARTLAVSLLMEGANLSSENISRLLDMDVSTVDQLVKSTQSG